jgi:hypothetical protein
VVWCQLAPRTSSNLDCLKQMVSWSPISPSEICLSLTASFQQVAMRRKDFRLMWPVQLRLREQRQDTISESRHRRPACREEGRGNRETRERRESRSMRDGGNDGQLQSELRVNLCVRLKDTE